MRDSVIRERWRAALEVARSWECEISQFAQGDKADAFMGPTA